MRRALAIGAACSAVAFALLFWLTRGSASA
jgi:hypothetical protein